MRRGQSQPSRAVPGGGRGEALRRLAIRGRPQARRRGAGRVDDPVGGRNRRRGRGSAWPWRRAAAGRPGRPGGAWAPGADEDQRVAADRAGRARAANSRWLQPPGRPSSGSIDQPASARRRRPARAAAARDRRHGSATSGPAGGISSTPELGHPEQLERLLVAGAVDRGRADDRPVEARARRPVPRPWPSTRRTATVAARARRARRRGRTGARPPAVAAASIASVPSTLPASNAGLRRCALSTPATWIDRVGARRPALRARRGRRVARRPSRRRRAAAAARRVRARDLCPAASAASSRCAPTKPVPPVIASFTAATRPARRAASRGPRAAASPSRSMIASSSGSSPSSSGAEIGEDRRAGRLFERLDRPWPAPWRRAGRPWSARRSRACRRGRRHNPSSSPRTTRQASTGSSPRHRPGAAAPGVRSTWPRKRSPIPAPSAAPSISPGMSATTNSRPLWRTTPSCGRSVVKG